MIKLDDLNIEPLRYELAEQLQYKIDQKAKPVGSLGQMERLAKQIGLIQGSLTPQLSKPVMLTVAADHRICDEGVSPCPVEITWQQCLNFLNGGGGIGLFSQEYGFDLKVVDAGVNFDFQPHPRLIDAKVRKGTRNFLEEPAMTIDECLQALNNGRNIVAKLANEGTNVVGFGEMGIGNTSPASALLSVFTGLDVDKAVGPGSGLTAEGVKNKARVLGDAIKKHGISDNAIENLARFGGLEIATIAGGMLEAAARRMIIITDGFITTSALLAAHAIEPNVVSYALFSHQSQEQGHKHMVDYLGGEPILDLGFRLGEGTGAAVAYTVVKGAVAMLNKMTSFDEAAIVNTANLGIRITDESKN
ncbi:nicotinate-nucleotide--dimethylbenzimidazole phosphoribosyltransferase [Carboxylicivirga mesophila]|uniref:Nicotinate-nucleotide--dimethylbenzimidazole phosphoribosyltransferase n=1 Tax=Carboxylicivirga mesophila TaxID=1166478 RepID=A0ABS5KDA0_9BACT|nr:nicotinate-nucleotide--dimethylbenzimidazole phosphoribosyltransferase [Carboxylicivirga mesophila]MBS2212965.1 nicotinate-nucleotide--dimethylbenzimidazole phosphoribosyltransferase [Carboxylicivirga mesophila]